MDITVLKTFISVCEYAGFSAAAEKLGYTQSTVSSQIRQLERELDTVLFERYYHKISLTEDGITTLKYARDILASHEQLLTALHNPETLSAELRLAISSSVCNRYFKDDFLRFRELYPDIHVIITESGTEQMFDMLRKNEVDLVFTLDNHIYDSEFEICAERHEDAHFIAAADNPLTKRHGLTLADAAAQPMILTERDMSYRKLLDARLASASLEVRPVLEIGDPLQICAIVERSDLISFLPDFIAAEYWRPQNLALLPVEDCVTGVWTQLLIHKNKWKSPALTVFIDYYREVIRKK